MCNDEPQNVYDDNSMNNFLVETSMSGMLMSDQVKQVLLRYHHPNQPKVEVRVTMMKKMGTKKMKNQ